VWYSGAIQNIIRNEKYAGDALLQKSFRPNFKSRDKKVNNNVLPKYYIEHNHIPIVSKEIFLKAQKIRLLRIEKYKGKNAHTYSPRSTFNKLLFCPYCKSNFQHRVNHHGTEYSEYMMQCTSNKLRTICHSEKVSIQVFNKQILAMVNTLILSKNSILKQYEDYIKNDTKRKNLLTKKETLKIKINDLIQKRLTSSNTNTFANKINIELQKHIIILTEDLNMIENKLLIEYNYKYKVLWLRKLLSNYNNPITSIDDFPFKKFFSKVIVVSRNDIRFVIGDRTDFSNIKLRRRVLFQDHINYKIRKTNYESKYSLIFF
jgi:hypothetical protein